MAALNRLTDLDWAELFVPQLGLPEIFVRATVVYFTLLVLLRVLPKWQASTGGVASMLFIVILGGLAADAIKGQAATVTDPLLMVFVVMLWVVVVDKLSYRFPLFRRLAEAAPTCLVRNGRVLHDKLDHEAMTVEDLKQELRRQGVDDIGKVREAWLEPDGSVTVLQRERRPANRRGATTSPSGDD